MCWACSRNSWLQEWKYSVKSKASIFNKYFWGDCECWWWTESKRHPGCGYGLQPSLKDIWLLQWGIGTTTYLFMTEITATSTLFLSFFYWTFLFSPKVRWFHRGILPLEWVAFFAKISFFQTLLAPSAIMDRKDSIHKQILLGREMIVLIKLHPPKGLMERKCFLNCRLL